ncbi:MAG: hypothetical protein AAGF95_32355 [Chloroflexota bacterium]
MDTFTQSQHFHFPTDKYYQALDAIFEQLAINLRLKDTTTHRIRGDWRGSMGTHFTIEAVCIPANQTSTEVQISYNSEWSPALERPGITQVRWIKQPAVPIELRGRINTIYTAMDRMLQSPEQQIDVRAIEAEPLPVITKDDKWLPRFRKRLWGSSPFVSGVAGGFMMSAVASVPSSIVAFLTLMTMFQGWLGLTIVNYVYLMLWGAILYLLVRLLNSILKSERLYQPSQKGLIVGIGSYLVLSSPILITLLLLVVSSQ